MRIIEVDRKSLNIFAILILPQRLPEYQHTHTLLADYQYPRGYQYPLEYQHTPRTIKGFMVLAITINSFAIVVTVFYFILFYGVPTSLHLPPPSETSESPRPRLFLLFYHRLIIDLSQRHAASQAKKGKMALMLARLLQE